MRNSVFLSLGALLLLLSSVCRAEKGDFRIFGRVMTVDNQTFEGYITWGKSKMYWTDFFKACKMNNPYASYFEHDKNVTFVNQGQETDIPPVHPFICRFGNIKSLEPISNTKVRLETKNGYSQELRRSIFHDVGNSVDVFHPSAGNIRLRWDKIIRVEFMPDTLCIDSFYNIPITGIVKTTQGIYKGLITWDRDEKTLDGTLDGRTKEGERSFRFKNIRKIIKTGNSCQVTLKNGKTFEMGGSNDVNNQNRGILVNMPNIGLVSIPWHHFESFEALPLQSIQTLSYNDFQIPRRLQGQVITRKGTTLEGILAYDLDEAMDFEILDGSNDNIEYEIPFKYLKSLEPKNYKYSFITLKNGSSLSLGDNGDVDETNSGILIFSIGKTPVYVPWKEISKIIFD